MGRRFISPFIKIVFVLGGFFLSLSAVFSQTNRRYALSLQTDNDSYLMTGQDQYYTNGLVITFDKPLQQNSGRGDLLRLELGHQLFNGSEVHDRNDYNWDRPSTGRFFLNSQFQRIYTNEWLWTVKAEVGVVGGAGQGKQIQHFIHRLFNMYEVESWESDLRSSVGVDIEGAVMKKLWRNQTDHFEISGSAVGRGGMNFSHFSGQVYFRVGKLTPYRQSHFTGNGGFFSDEREYYFFYTPGYMYQFYDATIEGALFARRKDERYHISSHVLTQQVGFAYSKGRFSIDASFLFNTREGEEMLGNHQYGRIKTGFRF